MIHEFPLIGESLKFREIVEIARKAAITESAVLITGESGTGKEVIARLIAASSYRAEKPFVSVNCAAIPDQLLENELFGHVRGAFTDAVEDTSGKIGAAQGGTFFLDEIGEMKLDLQVKLLRVLQFKEYEPLGSVKSLKADIRLIAATQQDLISLIKSGKFRSDLYYRLNVISIHLPPLRDRKEDIPLLTDFFIDYYSKLNNKRFSGLTESARRYLQDYTWPGNIRELQNIVERLVVFDSGKKTDRIDIQSLSEADRGGFLISQEILPLKLAIDKFKKEYIIEVLDRVGWNQTRAAEKLDIQRTYLVRLIKELKIDKL